jgi:hypothetical protein
MGTWTNQSITKKALYFGYLDSITIDDVIRGTQPERSEKRSRLAQ